MGGDRREVLGYYLGERVKGGPRGFLAIPIIVALVNGEEEAKTMEFYVMVKTARLPWWERFYVMNLLLQRS